MANPVNSSHVSLTTRAKLYRNLQILEKQLNRTLSTRVIPAILVVVPAVEIFCTFVVIKLLRFLPSEEFYTYPYATFICVTVLMVFETFAAQLFVNSEQLCTDWLKEPGLTRLNRRRIRSLQPMRIKVGSNFVDRGSALITQDFCINQTVSLLLM